MKTITHILITTAAITLTTCGFAQDSKNPQKTPDTHTTKIIPVVNPMAAVMVRNSVVQKAASERVRANKIENKNSLDKPTNDFIATNFEESKLACNTNVNKK